MTDERKIEMARKATAEELFEWLTESVTFTCEARLDEKIEDLFRYSHNTSLLKSELLFRLS